MMFACWKFYWVLGSAAAALSSSPRFGRGMIVAAIEAQQQHLHQVDHSSQQQPHAHNNKDLPTNRVIQWDEGGTLTAIRRSTIGTQTLPSFDGSSYTIPNVIQAFVGYYNGAQCQSFDGCVAIQTDGTTVSLPGQYLYDCSNVYCGPNAARDCNGTYRDTTCQAGNNSQAPIPLLRNVNCAFYENALATTELAEQCGACEEDNEISMTSITCEPRCLGCDDSNHCVALQELVVFTELLRSTVSCISETNGPQFCITKHGPSGIGNQILFSCTASVDGAVCSSCSICGVKDNARKVLYAVTDILFEADCTNVDNISRFNECTGTASGGFELVLRDYDSSTCQGQPAASVGQTQPVAAPAFAMSVLTATQPQYPAQEAPVLQPTAVLRPPAPVTAAPGTSSVAAPVAVLPNGTPIGAPSATLVGVPAAAPTEPKIPSRIFSSSGKVFVSKGLVVVAAGLFLGVDLS